MHFNNCEASFNGSYVPTCKAEIFHRQWNNLGQILQQSTKINKDINFLQDKFPSSLRYSAQLLCFSRQQLEIGN